MKLDGRIIAIVIVVLLPLVTLVMLLILPIQETAKITVLWLAGGAALGFLSGFTTGASEQTGTAAEFLKFLSAGVLVPLIGGVTALLRAPQITKETTTSTAGVTEKVITTGPSTEGILLHPLSVLGSFFLVYSLFAVLGIGVGMFTREKGHVIKIR